MNKGTLRMLDKNPIRWLFYLPAQLLENNVKNFHVLITYVLSIKTKFCSFLQNSHRWCQIEKIGPWWGSKIKTQELKTAFWSYQIEIWYPNARGVACVTYFFTFCFKKHGQVPKNPKRYLLRNFSVPWDKKVFVEKSWYPTPPPPPPPLILIFFRNQKHQRGSLRNCLLVTQKFLWENLDNHSARHIIFRYQKHQKPPHLNIIVCCG